jgi:hypothetical protein
VSSRMRICIDLSRKDMLRIKQASESATRAEVIRKAIRLYHWVMLNQNKGAQIVMRNGKKETTIEFI